MPRDLDAGEIAQLDALISATGLDSVMMALSEICGLRGERIAKYDATRAKAYFTLEGLIGSYSTQARGLD